MVSHEEISLTAREYGLLEYLIRNKNNACSRADLFSHVWDESANMMSNSVDVYIRFLRRKLGPETGAQIRTIKGHGYKLCDP
jgi:DNA-binding response OmpR family regulator